MMLKYIYLIVGVAFLTACADNASDSDSQLAADAQSTNSQSSNSQNISPQNRKDTLMKCRQLTPEQFKMAEQQFEDKHRYELSENGHETITFHFNLEPAEVGNALFAIKSQNARSLIYLGAYSQTLDVTVDEKLMSQGKYDNLQFMILQTDEGKVCQWLNGEDSEYLTHNASIRIDFLEEFTIDENEVMKQFEVTISQR